MSPVNLEVEPFYLSTADLDPQKSFNPMSDFTFAHSFNGDDQPAQVLAKRDLDGDGEDDPVTLHWSIDGEESTAPTEEWPDPTDTSLRYGGGNVYYHIVRGHVTGAEAGDDVEVWFEGGGQASDSFTFHVEETNAADVLILADTDYTGPSNFPAYAPADGEPPFLSDYEDALPAGTSHDVYDVDAMGAAPDHLGVLGHYGAVIWYTANDLLSRVAGQPGGTGAETQANSMMLEVRAFLNEGGRLLYTGRHAGWQFANAFDYNPVSTPPLCDAVDLEADDGCLFLSDDFLQYWLGAYLFVEDGERPRTAARSTWSGTTTPTTTRRPTRGRSTRSSSPAATPRTSRSSRPAASSRPTSSRSSRARPRGVWNSPFAGAYEPHSGDFYMYSQRADIRYQRLMNTFEVDSGTNLSFFISHDTEPAWDFVFVEVQGEDGQWVTLPGGERTHGHQHRGLLSRGLARAPSVADPVPGRGLRRDRMERGVRPVEWLDRVGVRPERLRRAGGDGLDLVRERLGRPGARRVGRRHHRADDRGRGQHRLRRRHGELDHR